MADTQVPAGFVPFDEIPDSGIIPDGVYQVTLEEVENTPSSTGKKMYSARYVVDTPDEYVGSYVFENFVIGSDDDPEATQLSTWKASVGARRWKQMCKAAGIPSETDEAKLLASAVGTKLMLSISMFTESKGDYKGTVRNRIGGFHRVGERKAEITAKPGAAKPMVKAPVAPVAPVPPTPASAPTPPPVQAAAPVGELPCGICGKQVPIPQFQAHIAECMSAANAA